MSEYNLLPSNVQIHVNLICIILGAQDNDFAQKYVTLVV